MRSSKRILLFGGHGQTGLKLTPLLINNNHTVHSIIRSASQIPDIEKLGAAPILQDLAVATVKRLVQIMSDVKPNVIVWVAGASGGPGSDPSQPEEIDHKAQIRVFDAMVEADVKRYISVSALDVRDRSKDTPPWYDEGDRAGSERLWKVLGPVMEAKLKADRDLVGKNGERGLYWNIVRPGRLLGDDGVNKVEAGRVHFGKGVSRQDVARVISFCVDDEEIKGLAFDVVGGETDLEEALERVAKKREDCFEGFY